MNGAKGLYFGANNAVLVPVFFLHRRRRRHENWGPLAPRVFRATATSVDEKDWNEDGVVRAKIQTFSTIHFPTATCRVLLKSTNLGLVERYFCLALADYNISDEEFVPL